MSEQFGRGGREHPPALEDLLDELHELRLTLAADLAAAAAAVDSGADDVAADIVDGDRDELARFRRVAEERLGIAAAATAPARPGAWRRRLSVALPVVPVVSALAVSAAAASGVLPLPGDHPRPGAAVHSAQSATAQPADVTSPPRLDTVFGAFVDAVGSHSSESRVMAAADRLHRRIARLIEAAPDQPARAERIARLLRLEQSLVLAARPPGAAQILDAARRLTARLATVVPQPASPVAVLPTVGVTLTPEPGPTSPAPDAHRRRTKHRHDTPTSSTHTTPPPSDESSPPAPSDSPSPILPWLPD